MVKDPANWVWGYGHILWDWVAYALAKVMGWIRVRVCQYPVNEAEQ